MMNRNFHIIVSLILCLCLLSSCTAANPALDETDVLTADEAGKPGNDTGIQQDGGEQARPTGSGDAQLSESSDIEPSGSGDTQLSGSGDTQPSGSNDIEPGKDLSNAGSDVEPAEANISAVDRIRHELQKDDPPVVSYELIKLFFDYYRGDQAHNGPNHWYELRTLPDFGDGTELDWDGLVLFAFMLSQHEINAEGYSYMPKETLEKTVGRLFPGLEYTHRSSSLFDYDGDRYTATGWDFYGGEYYRLREISRNNDGTFRAAFYGFSFHEFDSFEEDYDYLSDNMKALINHTGEIKPDTDMSELVLELFYRDDYSEIMYANERVEITFKLSDDPEFAFKYLSCKREMIYSE